MIEGRHTTLTLCEEYFYFNSTQTANALQGQVHNMISLSTSILHEMRSAFTSYCTLYFTVHMDLLGYIHAHGIK